MSRCKGLDRKERGVHVGCFLSIQKQQIVF